MRALRAEYDKIKQHAEGVVSQNCELRQERDGLREQMAAASNNETTLWRMLEAARSEAIMLQREHASIIADANAARVKAEQERDGLHLCGESVARMAEELKADRDLARQEAATLRRQIELVKPMLEWTNCEDCPARGQSCKETRFDVPCGEVIFAWAAQQAKGGK
jgi:regulator of replication initiation timing